MRGTITAVAAIITVSLFAWGAEARGGGHGGHGGRVSYGGGHHTTSHGGHYVGGRRIVTSRW